MVGDLLMVANDVDVVRGCWEQLRRAARVFSGLPRDFGSLMSEKLGRSAWSRRALIRRKYGDVVTLGKENDEMIFQKRGGLLNFRQQVVRQTSAPGKLARRRSVLFSTNRGREGPSFRRFCWILQVAAFPTWFEGSGEVQVGLAICRWSQTMRNLPGGVGSSSGRRHGTSASCRTV